MDQNRRCAHSFCHVVGLQVTQEEREEIPALHFDQSRATTLRLLLPSNFAGSLLFHNLRANSASVDDHFAPIGRCFRGEREGIGDIMRASGGLVEDLVDLDIYRGARRLKPAFDRFERKMNLRLF